MLQLQTQTNPRAAGVLLHVTSLPGPHGVGDLGPAAFRWVDALAAAGQAWWQVLPLNPPGKGDSPYQAYSAFAGNPLLIGVDGLAKDGLLTRADLRGSALPPGPIDFAAATTLKGGLLVRAFERFQGGAAKPLRTELARFRRTQAAWLDDYALYMALLDAHGDRPWGEWDAGIKRRQPAAMADARRSLFDRIDRHAFDQFLFARQWQQLKTYAADRGVRVIGDIPIFVSGDSADVWAHPEQFLLDRQLKPTVVAGVPPDYFSKTGQRWGNPLYNWKRMAADEFGWWVARLRTLLEQTDLVRIDHFRGFAACWNVPASEPTAVHGKWVKTRGQALLTTVEEQLGRLPFIAEDLGVITPDVEALRDGFGLPGMRVLQFGFGGGPDNVFLPHHHVRNAVVYTGTHDNDTSAGWFASLDKKQRRHAADYVAGIEADPAGALIRLAWQSVADLAITPAQDVLRLGSDARMNTPGTDRGNWMWRLADDYRDHDGWDELGAWTETYGRKRPLAPRAAGVSSPPTAGKSPRRPGG
jgi:4-alpha-glucanotransferase